MRVVLKVEIPEECRVRGKGGVVKFRRFRFDDAMLPSLRAAINPHIDRWGFQNRGNGYLTPHELQGGFQRRAEPVIHKRMESLARMLGPNDARLLTAWLDANRNNPKAIIPLFDTSVPLDLFVRRFNTWAGRFRLPDSLPYSSLSCGHPFDSYRDSANLPV